MCTHLRTECLPFDSPAEFIIRLECDIFHDRIVRFPIKKLPFIAMRYVCISTSTYPNEFDRSRISGNDIEPWYIAHHMDIVAQWRILHQGHDRMMQWIPKSNRMDHNAIGWIGWNTMTWSQIATGVIVSSPIIRDIHIINNHRYSDTYLHARCICDIFNTYNHTVI